jgi:UPF0271 protein
MILKILEDREWILSSGEVRKLIIDQYEILQKIADNYEEKVTHIKPHGALNNMACEDID